MMEANTDGNFASDEEVDSDIEGYLYSQLHYSTDLNLGSDSELVIDKEDTSEDEVLPDIIPITNEESRAEEKDLWAIHEKDLKGADAYVESFGKKKRYYLGAQGSKIKCNNCKERGHIAAECPKVEICHLCGLQGHSRWTCPNDICYNCYEVGHIAKICRVPKRNYYAVCKRCWGRGHNRNTCPEIWRQYHLTVKDTDAITRPSYDDRGTLKSIRKIRYCYNCGEEGHFGHDCKRERPHRRPVNSPFIVFYDRCPYKSRKDSKPKEKTQRRLEKEREKYDFKEPRKSESLREESSHNDGNKCMKYANDESRYDRKNRNRRETERRTSIDKHRGIDKAPCGTHRGSHEAKLKEKSDEKERSHQSRSMKARVQKSSTARKIKDDENARNVENAEGEKKVVASKSDEWRPCDFDKEKSLERECNREGRLEKGFWSAEVSVAEDRRNKIKNKVSSNNEIDIARKRKSDEIIDLTSNSNESRIGIKEAVKINRGSLKRNRSVAEHTEFLPRKKVWNDSMSSTEVDARKEQLPFKVDDSDDMINLDDSENFEFIDIDIYAESDSSLEERSERDSRGTNQASTAERPKDDDVAKTGKKIKKQKLKNIDQHSTEKLGNAHSAKTSENRPHGADASPISTQACEDEIVAKSESFTLRCREKVKEFDSIKVDFNESNNSKKDFAGKVTMPGVESNFANVCIDARADIEEDTRKERYIPVGSDKGNSLKADTLSNNSLLDIQHRSRAFARRKSERSETANTRNYDNSELVGSMHVVKGETHRPVSDFVAENGKTVIRQSKFPGRKLSPNHNAKETEKGSSLKDPGLEMGFFFDKSKQKANNDSLHGRKALKDKVDTKLTSKARSKSNSETCVMEYLPLSVPPIDIKEYGCTDTKIWGGNTEEPTENLFIEDHAAPDYEMVSGDDGSLSDPGDFQFSNMHFDQVSDSSSEDDLRKKIDSLKSKRSGRYSSVVQFKTDSNALEYYSNDWRDGDIDNSDDLHSEIQMSLDSVDRRQIDMTRYDPKKCSEDDVSAYHSYAGCVSKERPSFQPNNRTPQRVLTYGKTMQDKRNHVKTSSPFNDGKSPKEPAWSKKRTIERKHFVASPVIKSRGVRGGKERPSPLLEREATSQLDRGNRTERLVSVTGERKLKGKWKRRPTNDSADNAASKHAYVSELKGKGKKARKVLKRKWRQAILVNGGPKWLKELANFDEQAMADGNLVGAVEDRRDFRTISRIVEKKGSSGPPIWGKERIVQAGKITPSHIDAVGKAQQIQKKSIKRSIMVNRGFKSSDTAKSFRFDGYV